MSERIIYEEKQVEGTDGLVAVVTLNRPEAENAVDGEMLGGLREILEKLKGREEVRIALFRGNGGNFCAGREPPKEKPSPSGFKKALTGISEINRLLWSLPCITMSEVRGKAEGFGCGLALQTDVTISSDNSVFSFPEINGGLAPAIVLSYVGDWIPRKKAFELIITGREVHAPEALSLGMVNEVVPDAQLEAAVARWQKLLMSKSSVALKICKQYMHESRHLSTEDAMGYGLLRLVDWMATR